VRWAISSLEAGRGAAGGPTVAEDGGEAGAGSDRAKRASAISLGSTSIRLQTEAAASAQTRFEGGPDDDGFQDGEHSPFQT
jgi:hypothetical protein